MTLWDWATAAYGRPGVAQACLALQDDHGQSVCLLLWAAWAKVRDPARLAAAAEAARVWEQEALAPLRQARRGLKPQLAGFDDAARLALREEVRACELAAERLLLETLAGLGGPTGETTTLQALKAVSLAWEKPASDTALTALAVALD